MSEGGEGKSLGQTPGQFFQNKMTVEIAQLWTTQPRQLHYSNNLSQKQKMKMQKLFVYAFLRSSVTICVP